MSRNSDGEGTQFPSGRVIGVLASAPAIAAVLFVLQAPGGSKWQVLAVASVTALACSVGGAFLGFLFAIPKALTASPLMGPDTRPPPSSNSAETVSAQAPAGAASNTTAMARYGANTNLEDISDWLTKILVGITLVQFSTLTKRIDALDTFVAKGLGAQPASQPFVLALMIYAALVGFLLTYIPTRVRLPSLLTWGERQALDTANAARQSAQEISNELQAQDLTDAEAMLTVNQYLGQGSQALTADELAALRQTLKLASTRQLVEIGSVLRQSHSSISADSLQPLIQVVRDEMVRRPSLARRVDELDGAKRQASNSTSSPTATESLT